MGKKFLCKVRTRIIGGFALILCSLIVLSYFQYLPANADEEIVVDMVAHRGYSGLYPENTLSAFAGAVACGVETVEFDVRKTKDGVLVIYHDDTLENITGDETTIADYTYDELMAFDAGSWYSDAYICERIPTLDQALDILSASGVKIFCELKDIGEDPEFPAEVYMTVEDHGMLDRVVFSSFNYNYLAAIKTIDEDQPIMVLASFGKSNLPTKYPAEYYGINMKTLTSKTIVAIHDAGALVYAYTPDTRGQVLGLQRLGVDGVITNYPDMDKGSYVDEIAVEESSSTEDALDESGTASDMSEDILEETEDAIDKFIEENNSNINQRMEENEE